MFVSEGSKDGQGTDDHAVQLSMFVSILGSSEICGTKHEKDSKLSMFVSWQPLRSFALLYRLCSLSMFVSLPLEFRYNKFGALRDVFFQCLFQYVN